MKIYLLSGKEIEFDSRYDALLEPFGVIIRSAEDGAYEYVYTWHQIQAVQFDSTK